MKFIRILTIVLVLSVITSNIYPITLSTLEGYKIIFHSDSIIVPTETELFNFFTTKYLKDLDKTTVPSTYNIPFAQKENYKIVGILFESPSNQLKFQFKKDDETYTVGTIFEYWEIPKLANELKVIKVTENFKLPGIGEISITHQSRIINSGTNPLCILTSLQVHNFNKENGYVMNIKKSCSESIKSINSLSNSWTWVPQNTQPLPLKLNDSGNLQDEAGNIIYLHTLAHLLVKNEYIKNEALRWFTIGPKNTYVENWIGDSLKSHMNYIYCNAENTYVTNYKQSLSKLKSNRIEEIKIKEPKKESSLPRGNELFQKPLTVEIWDSVYNDWTLHSIPNTLKDESKIGKSRSFTIDKCHLINISFPPKKKQQQQQTKSQKHSQSLKRAKKQIQGKTGSKNLSSSSPANLNGNDKHKKNYY
jgi:hypothetical protein